MVGASGEGVAVPHDGPDLQPGIGELDAGRHAAARPVEPWKP